ncbi:Phospholipid hydroperoxide glutathione peroxidase, mitochondrial [Sciurus carolinensis]|uniref:phospholipid-hydroperoxide glutathione peroxidase n=1 Tax=Sciurus carolinensis TaxID=30640 RepID=A0AA41SY55_SCICA|nr:Phospholipid hydroperoxide glutathione peroxidase, mitochondrial [Sciurus carolinensis]
MILGRLSRLSRLLKPALLCGALAAPGLAGAMSSSEDLDLAKQAYCCSAPLALQCASHDDWRCCRSMHDFSAKDIDGHMVCLDKYKWEPGTDEEIKEFAASYNVKFDMYSKICVNGEDAHPLWKWMKVQPKGKGMLGNAIKWNFTKFLIDKNGCVVKRYGPMEEPLVIEKDLPCYL